jgi:lipopolysaccharide biosynthesis regulator YciM
MTARLENLANYIAALIVIKNELSSQEEIREELSQAIEAFNKEIQAARKSERPNVGTSRILLRQRTKVLAQERAEAAMQAFACLAWRLCRRSAAGCRPVDPYFAASWRARLISP